jgi:hypothetical protein
MPHDLLICSDVENVQIDKVSCLVYHTNSKFGSVSLIEILVYLDPSLSNDDNILKKFSEENYLHDPGWDSIASSILL